MKRIADRKREQVFLLYETVPHDPYEPDRLEGVYATMELAEKETRKRPVHPLGRPDENGVREAKPLGGPWGFGVKVVPTDVLHDVKR